jgi:hypothetical protein
MKWIIKLLSVCSLLFFCCTCKQHTQADVTIKADSAAIIEADSTATPELDRDAYFRQVDTARMAPYIRKAGEKMMLLMDVVQAAFSEVTFTYSYTPGKRGVVCKFLTPPEMCFNAQELLMDISKRINTAIQTFALEDTLSMYDSVQIVFYVEDQYAIGDKQGMTYSFAVDTMPYIPKDLKDRIIVFNGLKGRETDIGLMGKAPNKKLYLRANTNPDWLKDRKAIEDVTKAYARFVYAYSLGKERKDFSNIGFAYPIPGSKDYVTFDFSTSDTLFTNIYKVPRWKPGELTYDKYLERRKGPPGTI